MKKLLPLVQITSVPVYQLLMLCGLSLIGACLVTYAIRVEVKLTGILIEMITLTLFLIKDKQQLNNLEKIQFGLTLIILVIVGSTSFQVMSKRGAVPPLPPENVRVLEQKDGHTVELQVDLNKRE